MTKLQNNRIKIVNTGKGKEKEEKKQQQKWRIKKTDKENEQI